MRKLFILCFLFLVFGLQHLQSREFIAGITYFQLLTAGNSFDVGSGGTSIELTYRHNFQSHLKWYAGIEAGTALWGTQILSDVGIVYSKEISRVFNWEATAGMQQGVALFKPSSLYAGGLTSTFGIQANLSKRTSLAFSAGLRYIICPAYHQFSNIAGSIQIPLNISYRIKL